jgi:peptidoglycan biosynthesis protein MviN/MurJ (putative lipid II flippase)
MNGSALILNIILNLFLIPRYGLVGAAISAGFSEMLILGIGIFFLRKHSSFFPSFLQLSKVFLASLGMGIFAYVGTILLPVEQNHFVFLAILLISGVIYLGLLFVFKFFTKEMIQLLKRSDPINKNVMDLRDVDSYQIQKRNKY